MINQIFNEDIEFKGVRYHLEAPQNNDLADRFVFSKANRVPFIACFTNRGSLQFNPRVRTYRRLLDADMVLQLFINGSHVAFAPIRKHAYYVGKGVLLDQDLKVLAMITVTEEFYHHFRRNWTLTEDDIRHHFTLVISHAFESEAAHKTLHGKFRKIYKGAVFNKTFTSDPEFESFARVSIPVFPSLQQRQAFINSTVAEVFGDFITC